MSDPLSYAFEPVDPVGEALHALRLSGAFYCRSELRAPWGIALPPIASCMMFHIVTSGSCVVEVEGRATQRLGPGDMVLYPHGRGHRVRSDAKAKTENLFDLPRELLGPRYEVLRHGGSGEETLVICGVVTVDDPTAKRVVALLPEVLFLRAMTLEHEWLYGAVRWMTSEAQSMKPGGDTIITRIADILVVQAIRTWLMNDEQARQGWLGALRDPQVGKALALVHRAPTEPWSVESLALRVGMSRSAFAARFTTLMGETPMAYVRAFRLDLAVDWLEDGSLSMGEIAERLAYQSEAAFNRAFKQHTGRTPGDVRRKARRPATFHAA
jgi:AraC-like DNA-binding protein